jgi:hypothetical protein
LEEVVLLQSTALKEDQTKQSFALVSPKSASLVLTEHVKLFLGLKASEPLDVSASHDVVLKPTELCSVNDVVLVKTCGQESVGMVWFHIEARGTLYTIWAPWLPVQGSPNTFKVKEDPEFIETRTIQRCLVYRLEGDQQIARVAP